MPIKSRLIVILAFCATFASASSGQVHVSARDSARPTGPTFAIADSTPKSKESEWQWDLTGVRATYAEVEPNNTCPGQQMVCSDVIDPARIDVAGDVDWYTFTGTAGVPITIGTDASGLCDPDAGDTYIYLYSSGCATVLAEDDDAGPGYYSLINAYNPTYTGVFNIKVQHFYSTSTGCYKLFVNCQPPVTGACCLGGGVCQVLNEAACGTAGGTYQGDNIVCVPNLCALDAVIVLQPDSLAVSAPTEDDATREIAVENQGSSPLTWSVRTYALGFDGVNDYMSVPDNANWDLIELTDRITIEAWIRVDSWYANWFSVVDKYESSNFGWTLQIHNTLGVNWVATPGTGGAINIAFVPTLGQWYYLAFTYDRSDQSAKLFVNGQQFGSTVVFSADILNTSGESLYLGYNPSGSTEYSHGVIGDCRLWSFARSQAEISRDMYRRLRGNEPGLVAYWPMDEGTGTTVHDASPNGNDGTLTNGPLWITTDALIPPWLTVGTTGGVVAPSESGTLDLTLHPSLVSAGDHLATLRLRSNDPNNIRPLLPILLRKLSPGGADAESPPVAGTIVVAQGDVQPATRLSSLRLGLSIDSPVWLAVYDAGGREVLRPLDGERLSAGWNSVPVDLSRLSSGIYFYKAWTPRGHSEGKITLVR